jgi:hypothetical protein
MTKTVNMPCERSFADEVANCASNDMGDHMTEKMKPTHTQPEGFVDETQKGDDEVVNDSFGTVDIADSTGLEEDKETGDAKSQNKDTRED